MLDSKCEREREKREREREREWRGEGKAETCNLPYNICVLWMQLYHTHMRATNSLLYFRALCGYCCLIS